MPIRYLIQTRDFVRRCLIYLGTVISCLAGWGSPLSCCLGLSFLAPRWSQYFYLLSVTTRWSRHVLMHPFRAIPFYPMPTWCPYPTVKGKEKENGMNTNRCGRETKRKEERYASQRNDRRQPCHTKINHWRPLDQKAISYPYDFCFLSNFIRRPQRGSRLLEAFLPQFSEEGWRLYGSRKYVVGLIRKGTPEIVVQW